MVSSVVLRSSRQFPGPKRENKRRIQRDGGLGFSFTRWGTTRKEIRITRAAMVNHVHFPLLRLALPWLVPVRYLGPRGLPTSPSTLAVEMVSKSNRRSFARRRCRHPCTKSARSKERPSRSTANSTGIQLPDVDDPLPTHAEPNYRWRRDSASPVSASRRDTGLGLRFCNSPLALDHP